MRKSLSDCRENDRRRCPDFPRKIISRFFPHRYNRGSMARRARNRKQPASPPAPTPRSPREDYLLVLRAAIIVALGVFIYAPALNGAWLWDDRDLIADNQLIHDPG